MLRKAKKKKTTGKSRKTTCRRGWRRRRWSTERTWTTRGTAWEWWRRKTATYWGWSSVGSRISTTRFWEEASRRARETLTTWASTSDPFPYRSKALIALKSPQATSFAPPLLSLKTMFASMMLLLMGSSSLVLSLSSWDCCVLWFFEMGFRNYLYFFNIN